MTSVGPGQIDPVEVVHDHSGKVMEIRLSGLTMDRETAGSSRRR
ncbi:hypothetical protein ACFFQW_21300 [Umezawaea endophytica]|uniref:Uncharacterized protein n=1 Tax=Umezawaea endophytica TaxID=1654476 RepID=A0A9X2VLM3_9PSEU|nr:hypothetical protein [Umezawaea endophytica]MCS7478850.1 hypothetical protein [Umezawaea endophytica]